jgi:hypothetical protein
MTRTLDDFLESLPPKQRERIEARSQELADQYLWDFVKQRITPLGTPDPHQKPLSDASMVMASRCLDMHGMTIAEAHRSFKDWVSSLQASGTPNGVIITGKSGEIRREFPTWADLHPSIGQIEEMNGGGAFRVFIRRPRVS